MTFQRPKDPVAMPSLTWWKLTLMIGASLVMWYGMFRFVLWVLR